MTDSNSDNPNDEVEDQSPAADDSADSAVAQEQGPRKHSARTKTPTRSGGLSPGGVLVGLMAVAALGLSAWVFLALKKVPDASALVKESATDTVSRIDASLGEFREQLEEIENRQTRIGRAAEEVRAQTESSVQDLAVQVRENSLTLSQVTGISQEARQIWILAEIEYLLVIANERLNLAGDSETALAALETADRRIQELNDPGLTVVRAQITDEVNALRSLSNPDIQGVALRLGSLSSAVRRFPLKATLAEQAAIQEPVATAEDKAGLDRAFNVMGDALSGMISVKKTEDNAILILSENEQELIYQNLELKIQSARLAVLQGDSVNFRESLRAARHWLGIYFDQTDAGVRGALTTLAEQESLDVEPKLPDISMSLRLLRQRRAASSAGP